MIRASARKVLPQALEGGLHVADGRLHFAFAIRVADATGQRDDAVVGEDIAIERVQGRVVDIGGGGDDPSAGYAP
jgi:hypothetical protein